MSYLLKYHEKDEEKKEYIQFEELNKNRKEYVKIQENEEQPVLFCECNDNSIPMVLTKHQPTPHFQTKFANDKAKHYRFCRHFIYQESKSVYKSAITVNSEGIEIAHISWENDEDVLENQITQEYKDENTFKYNNCDRVIQGKMTFDAFVKYKNMQYFRINQYTKKEFELMQYNRNLFGWICNSYIGKEKVKKLSKGKFFYGIVNNINKVKGEKYKIELDNVNIYCKRAVYDKAIKKFENTYNKLDINGILENKDYYVACYGINETKTKYSVCKVMGFIIINKYGLFCESLKEVKMFDLICDYIFQGNLKEKYIFYKPTEPENDYSNPNFISDGIIQMRKGKEKVVVEIFGRKEEDYIERKREKIESCKDKGIFWDVFDTDSWNECKNKLRQVID